MVFLMVLGLLASAAGIFYTDNFVQQLQASCLWTAPRDV